MILAPTLLLNAGSGAAIARPTFSRDFAGEKTLNNGTGPAINFTRAEGGATFFDANGVLQTAASGAPRFDHDPATGASRGLLIEEQRTNSIRNSQAGGSTNGVIGSGGVLPTNSSSSGASSNGISTEVIGTGTEDGLHYIDLKVSGTPTASSSVYINIDGAAASLNQNWTASAYFRVVGGSIANLTTRIAVSERGSGGVDVGGTETTFTATTAAAKTQRQIASRTFASASVLNALQYVRFAYTSGNPIDLTLRIAAPQLEQGAFATSYIPTTTATATRAADSAVVTPTSSFYNQSEGTLFAEFEATTLTTGALSTNRRIARFDLSSDSTTFIDINQNGANDSVRFVSQIAGGAAEFDRTGGSGITNPTKAIIGFAANNIGFAVNGTTLTADTSAAIATVDRLLIGRQGGSNGRELQGYVRKIAYYPRRLSNTLLQQLTT